MRSVPERPAIVTLLVLFGAFVAGPLLGLLLGERLAPDSEVAQTASVFAFPLAFFAAMVFWFGLGVFTVVFGGIANLVRGRVPKAADLVGGEALVPPGYGAFVVLSLLASGGAGLLAGLLSGGPLLGTLVAYVASGAVYGGGLWWLAHHGYLPFPEPV